MTNELKPNFSPTTLYLVRHGQSIANTQGRFGLNTALTPAGGEQAQELSALLSKVPFTNVYASNLLRARQTAEILARPRGLRVEVKPGLKERYWGSIDGELESDVYAKFKSSFDKMKLMPEAERIEFKIVPDMETEKELMERFTAALTDITRYHPGQTVLLVSHQSVMRLFLMHIGFASYPELSQGSISNTGFVNLVSYGSDFEVVETHGVQKTDYWFYRR